MKKFGMILAFLAAMLFSGPVMAEEEYSPHKDSTGKLGTPEFSWRLGDIDTLTVNTDIIVPNVQRTIPLHLAAGMIVSGGDLSESTTPTLAQEDNVPCAQWDDSSETTAAQWTFRLPSDFAAGEACGLYALISSASSVGTNVGLRHAWWINGNDVTLDAAKITDDSAWGTSTTLDVSCEVLDLSANSTAITAFTAGAWVTAEVWALNISADDDVELKGLEFYYQSTI